MTIPNGTRLGPYEVLSAIGAGGMGEVYQAHDGKLGRDVAIKVLPQAFAHDPERLARFQREAKMLAALNHPNIAAIYGLEQSGDMHYLVMELVPGETLRDKVAGGRPVPVEEALVIAKQTAEALEAAHEKSIIHRDLKPANVKVTPEGRVKVLDFGLAKAFATDTATEDPSNSPTLSMNPTLQGAIMGTAAYMSPEQARGKVVTKATDIFAFGAVLYELLTGKQAFPGEDVAEILAAVMKMEPDWSALPTDTPQSIRMLLRRCLRKDRHQRLQDAAGLRIEIEDVLSGAVASEPVAPSLARWRQHPTGWIAATAVLLVALAAVSLVHFREGPRAAKAVRFFISPPESWNLPPVTTIGGLASAPLAVSPDGQRVAFIARNAEDKSLLWIRPVDTLAAEPLSGTDGALSPFWSPDSRFLGFWTGGKLKKIAIAGGPPIVLCDASSFVGGTWSRDGVIVFALGGNAVLQKVSAAGGIPTPATTFGQGDVAHLRPFFLPDGRHFLYGARTSTAGTVPVYLASLDSAERKMLLSADTNNVLFSQGHLLFMRETSLMAQPFDPRRLELTGEPFPIAEQIQLQVSGEPYGVFSASENGMLAYQTGTAAGGSRLIWFDRTGKQTGVLGEAAPYGDLDLSPDGTRATVALPDQAGKGHDIWLYDLARGLKTRFTFDPADEQTSRWSLDGSRVVFNSSRKGHYDLYLKASIGDGKEELLLEDNLEKAPLDWSPDGRFLLYRSIGQSTNNDLWVLPLSGDRKPVPYLATKFSEANGHFSPDGRWVVYNSTESGRNEVYVAPFPGPGSKWQISTGGGDYPRWRRDGAEIFYLAPNNKLMVAAVNGKGATFEAGVVKPLFDTRAAPGLRGSYAVSADGQRFLINTLPEQSGSAPITVVLNWTAGLKN